MADREKTMADQEIFVLANCIHLGLANTLRKNLPGVQVTSHPLFLLDDAAKARVRQSLETADVILTLEHSEKFAPLDTNSLRRDFPGRIFSCPTPFFSGQQPEMAYLIEDGNTFVSRVELLGDYNSGLLLEMAKSGRDSDSIVADYVSGAAFDLIDIPGLWKAGLDRLRGAEQTTEISISDIITELAPKKQLFLSFNHPTEDLICAIAEKFSNVALGFKGSFTAIDATEHDLYRDAFWPVHDAVRVAMGLTFEASRSFKRPDRMGGEKLSLEEFARLSCEFYTTHPNLQNLQVVTPDYLTKFFRRIVP